VEVSVSNDAYDHQLSVLFPIGADVEQIMADGHFEIRDYTETFRKTKRSESLRKITLCQRGFVSVCGAETGLTIANRGLPEVSVLQSDHGAQILLTLIRATGRLDKRLSSREMGDESYAPTPAAQCRGEYTFHYSIIPHGRDLTDAWSQAWAFQSPLRAIVTDIHFGSLPVTASMVTVDRRDFIISAIKTGADGHSVIVRGYSISTEIVQVRIQLGFSVVSAQIVRLDETGIGDDFLRVRDGSVAFEVPPAKVVTLRFEVGAA
jgi:alpha-mannosidase